MAIRTVEQARAWRSKLNSVTANLDGDAAQSVAELYPAWQPGIAVQPGERRRHEGVLYRCIQGHTTQSDWEPDITPALWEIL